MPGQYKIKNGCLALHRRANRPHEECRKSINAVNGIHFHVHQLSTYCSCLYTGHGGVKTVYTPRRACTNTTLRASGRLSHCQVCVRDISHLSHEKHHHDAQKINANPVLFRLKKSSRQSGQYYSVRINFENKALPFPTVCVYHWLIHKQGTPSLTQAPCDDGCCE